MQEYFKILRHFKEISIGESDMKLGCKELGILPLNLIKYLQIFLPFYFVCYLAQTREQEEIPNGCCSWVGYFQILFLKADLKEQYLRLQYHLLEKVYPWHTSHFLIWNGFVIELIHTAVIGQLRPEFKFPAKIEIAFSQMLAIRSWSNELQ